MISLSLAVTLYYYKLFKNDKILEALSHNSRRLIREGLSILHLSSLRRRQGIHPHIQKQTDASALARNPIFTNNTFFFDPPSSHMIKGSIIVHLRLLSLSPTLFSANRSPPTPKTMQPESRRFWEKQA